MALVTFNLFERDLHGKTEGIFIQFAAAKKLGGIGQALKKRMRRFSTFYTGFDDGLKETGETE